MKTSNQNLLFILICVLILSGIGYGIKYLFQEKENRMQAIIAHPKFTSATITEVRKRVINKVPYTRFYFDIDEPIGTDESRNIRRSKIPLKKEDYALLEGKRFPVVYSDAYPDEPVILLLKADFEKYKIPFPDSLNWSLPYLLK